MTGAILIAGPTASGKSALALALARHHNGVIINTDSMQIYKDLAVLSARPRKDEQAAIPHRLYGVLDGRELCSAARWHTLAMDAIDRAYAEGHLPILVGGTGLYFRTLLEGLAPVPAIDGEIRSRIRKNMAESGPQAMHRILSQHDPVMAARLAPADSQRIARALEVIMTTGRSLADYQKEKLPGGLAEADRAGRVVKVVLDLPRDALYARCDARFLQMMAQGALAEVERLVARNLDPDLPVMKALGVPALTRYLSGALTEDEAVKEAQQQTRNYAKRQMTWVRTQFMDWTRLDALDMNAASAMLKDLMKERIPSPCR